MSQVIWVVTWQKEKKKKIGPPCVRALTNQAALSGQMFSYKELFIK